MVGDYFQRYNPDLLALIPPDAKAVLEVGCGAGKLAEMHRRTNPGVEWSGIEIDKKAAKMARSPGRCDKVFGYDATYGEPVGVYECLIFGDVLEHMVDPWGCLERHTQHVLPGGQVLASIPNVQHWSVIASLLRGEWDYQDEGLFDRTHLRWFTLKSIKAMFKDAGLNVFEIRGRQINMDPAAMDEWRNVMANIESGNFTSLYPDLDKQSRVYQYIVRAIKPGVRIEDDVEWDNGLTGDVKHFDVPPKLHIHAVTAEECCARPRIHEPFAALATIPGVRVSTMDRSQTPRIIETEHGSSAILIQQRYRSLDVDIQHEVLGHDWIIVAEFDDHPDYIGVPPEALKAVHAVQVSTEALADVVRQYNPEVMVFPNQVADLPPPREYVDWPIRIVFAAQNRQDDWKPIMPALNRVLLDHGEDVEVMVIHDRDFYDAIDDKLVKSFMPFTDYATYRSVLRTCDIALLPLEDTEFNRCKSDLKFLECAADGAAVLMSGLAWEAVEAANTVSILNPIASVYERPDSFEMLLRILIENADQRRSDAAHAYAYIRDHRMLGQHYRKRLDWYRSLVNQKVRLVQALRERVPELIR